MKIDDVLNNAWWSFDRQSSVTGFSFYTDGTEACHRGNNTGVNNQINDGLTPLVLCVLGSVNGGRKTVASPVLR